MARGRNKEAEVPHEDKQRDQMALKEKLLMKEDGIDKGGENSVFSSGLAEKKQKQPARFFPSWTCFESQKRLQRKFCLEIMNVNQVLSKSCLVLKPSPLL